MEPEVIVPAPVVAEVVDVMPELTIVEVELIEQIEEMKEEIALSQDPSFVQHNSAGIQSSNLPEYLPQTGAEVK